MYKTFLKMSKILSEANLDIISSGNFSIRVNNTTFLIKPSGLQYKDIISEQQICKIKHTKDDNYKILKGRLLPSSDRKQHAIIYKNNPEINGIVHSHSHYATVFAILQKKLIVQSTMHADVFGKEVQCLNFINHRTGNFGDGIDYKDGKGFLLGHHGTITLGKNIEEAIKNAIFLEEIAKLQFHTTCIEKQKKTSLKQSDITIINKYYEDSYGNQKK